MHIQSALSTVLSKLRTPDEQSQSILPPRVEAKILQIEEQEVWLIERYWKGEICMHICLKI